MGKYVYADPNYDITIEDIDETINNNAEVWVNQLIVCLYYFGVRISEALMLRPMDFKRFIHKKSGRVYLQVRSPTLKKRKDKHRTLYVPMDQPYVLDLYLYARSVHSPHVFTYSRQWSRVKIQRLLPQVSPHVFRHSRLNDFAQNKETEFSLQSWAGWSDTRPAKDYVQPVKAREIADRQFPV